jgi:hypothetical protein
MTAREQEEYSALRATIAQRGTARVVIFVAGIAAWAALAVAIAAASSPPAATLLPLVCLAAVFEGVFALHVGVERIGRFLDVWHGDAWERAAMAFGRPPGAPAVDALFSIVFLLAALLNLMPAALAQPTLPELLFIGGAHALFIVRVGAARRAASAQRAIDMARFRELRESRSDASTK